MGMTVIEKILASHSGRSSVAPGDIVDVKIDARVARDFGGANVVKHMENHRLEIDDDCRRPCFETDRVSRSVPSMRSRIVPEIKTVCELQQFL